MSELGDVRVISEVEDLAKSDPEISRSMLERLGVPGERYVFGNDNPDNLSPAHHLGITTVLADGRPSLASRVGELLGIGGRIRNV